MSAVLLFALGVTAAGVTMLAMSAIFMRRAMDQYTAANALYTSALGVTMTVISMIEGSGDPEETAALLKGLLSGTPPGGSRAAHVQSGGEHS